MTDFQAGFKSGYWNGIGISAVIFLAMGFAIGVAVDAVWLTH